MARQKIIKKRLIEPDPFYNSVLIQKIVNKIMRKGKKSLAQRLLYQTAQEIEKKTQQDPIQVIEQAVYNIAPVVEIKSRRIGGAVYSIPIELNDDRSISTAINWIISYCKSRSGKTFVSKLANEIIEASKKMGSAVRKRDEVHKLAESSARLR